MEKRKFLPQMIVGIALMLMSGMFSNINDGVFDVFSVIMFFVGLCVLCPAVIRLIKSSIKKTVEVAEHNSLDESILKEFSKEKKEKSSGNNSQPKRKNTQKNDAIIVPTRSLGEIIKESDVLEENDWLDSFNKRLNNPIKIED